MLLITLLYIVSVTITRANLPIWLQKRMTLSPRYTSINISHCDKSFPGLKSNAYAVEQSLYPQHTWLCYRNIFSMCDVAQVKYLLFCLHIIKAKL